MLITRDTLRAALELPAPAASRATGARTGQSAAVVVPVRLGRDPAATLVLRSITLREHAGEVGFPGGKQDPGDADLLATALRELSEEVALGPGDVDVVGQLSPVPVITGRYLIHPFVVVVRESAEARVASPEIARLLDVPLLPWMTGAAIIGGVKVDWRGEDWFSAHFELDGCVLYGASGCIFYELLGRLATALGQELPAPRLQAEPPWAGRYKG